MFKSFKRKRLRASEHERSEVETVRRLRRELFGAGDDQPVQPAQDFKKTAVNTKQRRLAKKPLSGVGEVLTVQAGRRRKIIVSLIIVFVLLAVVVAIFSTYLNRRRVDVVDEQILLQLDIPQAATSGEPYTLVFEYGNDSAVAWRMVELRLNFPEGFEMDENSPPLISSGRQFILEVGELDPGQRETLTIPGKLIGEIDSEVETSAELLITPENFPSGRFSKKTRLTTLISDGPLDLSIAEPGAVISGQRVVVELTINNKSTETLDEVYIRLQPVPGVQLAYDDPELWPDLDRLKREWQVSLAGAESLVIPVVVFVEGGAGEVRELEVEVGIVVGDKRFRQRKKQVAYTLAEAEFSIEQRYNGSTETAVGKPGERVQGVVRFSNTSGKSLREVEATISFTGVELAAKAVRAPRGVYDSQTQTLAWTSATVADLATFEAKESAELTFEITLPAAADLPVVEDDQGGAVVLATASVTQAGTGSAKEGVTVTSRFLLSITSELLITVEALGDAEKFGISNYGPKPPKANEETTYALRFRAAALVGEAREVRMSAVLSDAVSFTGVSQGHEGELTYNEETREVVWQRSQLSTGGESETANELVFQVVVKPREEIKGQAVQFLERLTLTGTDAATDKELRVEATDLPQTEVVE